MSWHVAHSCHQWCSNGKDQIGTHFQKIGPNWDNLEVEDPIEIL